MSKEAMKLALKKAFQLGQDYWYQADHDSRRENKKSDETLAKFRQLVDETCEALAKPDFWEGYVPEPPCKTGSQCTSKCQQCVVQEPVAYPEGDIVGPCVELAQQALDKKAENARELGLDYAPAQQKPVDLEAVYETIIHWDEGGGKRSRRELARRIVALAEQPAQREPKTKDVVINNMGSPFTVKAYVTPQPQQQEPVAKDNSNYRLDPPGLDQLYTSPPAQRTWQGLTDEEMRLIDPDGFEDNLPQMIQQALKEKNT